MIAGLIEQSPLGRMAEPDDIADVALFLEYDDSRSMTGSSRTAEWHRFEGGAGIAAWAAKPGFIPRFEMQNHLTRQRYS